MTPNGRLRKLRPLEISKEKSFNSYQFHHLKCFMVTQCQTMFIGGKRQKEWRSDSYLLRFIAVASGGFKTDFNLNNIVATPCLLLR